MSFNNRGALPESNNLKSIQFHFESRLILENQSMRFLMPESVSFVNSCTVRLFKDRKFDYSQVKKIQYVEEAWFLDRRTIKDLKNNFCLALEYSNKLDTLMIGDRIAKLNIESYADLTSFLTSYKCTEFTMNQIKMIYMPIIQK